MYFKYSGPKRLFKTWVGNCQLLEPLAWYRPQADKSWLCTSVGLRVREKEDWAFIRVTGWTAAVSGLKSGRSTHLLPACKYGDRSLPSFILKSKLQYLPGLPLNQDFAFCGWSYPRSITVQMENSSNRQFRSFKLHTVLSHMMESRVACIQPTQKDASVHPLHAAGDSACLSFWSRLGLKIYEGGQGCRVSVQGTLILFNGPKAIHWTFVSVYCHTCYILLLVIIINLFIGLIYQLNFIIGLHISMRKKSSYSG